MRSYTSWRGRVPCARRFSPWPHDIVRHLGAMVTYRLGGVSLKQFVAECEVGDVLLFRGLGFAATMQEWTTASRGSHVGMVIQYEGQLCVLHATNHATRGDLLCAGGGLYVCPLAQYVPYYLRAAGIDVGMRKLVIAPNEHFAGSLDEWKVHVRADINNAALAYIRKHREDKFMENYAAFVAVAYPLLGMLLLSAFAVLRLARVDYLPQFAAESHGHIYCSQTVGQIYRDAGVFVDDVARTHFAYVDDTSESLSPSDFGELKQPAARTSLHWANDTVQHLPFADSFQIGETTWVY